MTEDTQTVTEDTQTAVEEDSDVAIAETAKTVYGNVDIEELDRPEYSEDQMVEFNALYDESFSGIKEGEVVQGRIVGVQAGEVLVDIGFKSEGMVSVKEFGDDPEAIAIGRGFSRDCGGPRRPGRAVEAEGRFYARLGRDQGVP